MAITLEEALVYKLNNTAGITALCSTRIYPEELPEVATIPAMTYRLISAPAVMDLSEGAGTALVIYRFQFDVYGATVSTANAVAAALFTALHGYKGTITSGANTYVIQKCVRIDKRDEKEPETGLYRRSQDYEIWGIE